MSSAPICSGVTASPLAIENSRILKVVRRPSGSASTTCLSASALASGAERAAVVYTQICTSKLNSVDPEAYLRNVLALIAAHPIRRIEALLPWNFLFIPTPDVHAA